MRAGHGSDTVRSELMTMWDVLELPSMAGASIVTGAGGLDRNVTNAMVLEGPDVEKWGRPGLLLLTSFYALGLLSPKERLEFFQRAAGVGVAGFVFKPGRLFEEVPEEYVRTCEECALPIVRTSADVTFETILMDIVSSVIDSNVTLLNRFFDIHRETMRLTLQQPSTQTIVRKLEGTLGYPVTHYNRTDDIRVSSSPSPGLFELLALRERQRERYQSFHYYDAVLSYADGEAHEALAVRVPGLDAQSSYLIVHREPRSVTPVDYMTIENYVSLLQIEALKETAIDQRIFNRNNVAVHDLLLNRLPSREAIDRSLKELGIDTHPYYQTMLLRISITDDESQGQLQDVFVVFRRRLKKRRLSTVFFQSGDRVTYLCNASSRAGGFDTGTVRDLLSDLGRDAELPAFTYLVALSEVADRYSLSKINEQVMGIYKLFGSDVSTSRIISYPDLGIYKLFIGTRDHTRIRSYVDPRLARLHEENPEGFRTLVALCEENLSYNAAAERLFVHPKTVHYRVGRISETYDVDVRRSSNLMQILVASTIYGLLGDAH